MNLQLSVMSHKYQRMLAAPSHTTWFMSHSFQTTPTIYYYSWKQPPFLSPFPSCYHVPNKSWYPGAVMFWVPLNQLADFAVSEFTRAHKSTFETLLCKRHLNTFFSKPNRMLVDRWQPMKRFHVTAETVFFILILAVVLRLKIVLTLNHMRSPP